ncbi:MAG TPA: hypothetical protein VFW48_10205 [Solirubrobacterales bacterium]|nr:hypothetical protein [Solirubrobacterales bacterium]
MTREGIRRTAALCAAVLAAGAISACGDSGSTTTGTSPAKEIDSGPGKANKTGSTGSNEGGSQSQQGDEPADPSTRVEPAPLKVSGGGSGQYRVEGGDNSIQNFGEEGEEGELEEAATALHDYLVARADEDWAAACTTLARTVTDQLDVLASKSDQLEGKDCAAILGVLTPPLPAAVRRESTIVDAGSLRLEDERAFLIYRGAKNAGYAVLMEQEDGAWKVGALAATPIS